MTELANSIEIMIKVAEFWGLSVEKLFKEDRKTFKLFSIEKIPQPNNFRIDSQMDLSFKKVTLCHIKVGSWKSNQLKILERVCSQKPHWIRRQILIRRIIWDSQQFLRKEMYFFNHHLCTSNQFLTQNFKWNFKKAWVLKIFDISRRLQKQIESKLKVMF